MSIDRQVLFWTIVFACLGFVLHLLGSTVTPFAAGIALGYLLDPIVRKLEKLGLNRLGAALLILVVFVSALAVILVVVAPVLSNQLLTFAQSFPATPCACRRSASKSTIRSSRNTEAAGSARLASANSCPADRSRSRSETLSRTARSGSSTPWSRSYPVDAADFQLP